MATRGGETARVYVGTCRETGEPHDKTCRLTSSGGSLEIRDFDYKLPLDRCGERRKHRRFRWRTRIDGHRGGKTAANPANPGRGGEKKGGDCPHTFRGMNPRAMGVSLRSTNE